MLLIALLIRRSYAMDVSDHFDFSLSIFPVNVNLVPRLKWNDDIDQTFFSDFRRH